MSFPRYPEYKDSGVPWLGAVPSHWEFRRTKFLFDPMKRPPRVDDEIVTAFRDGEVTLRSNRRVDGFTNALQEVGYQGVRKGDLVIHAMDAFAGAIGVSDSDGKSTPVYSVCQPRSSGISAWYYGRLLRHMALSGFINAVAKGIRERSTEFRWAEAGNVQLPLPPREEQLAIVAFLDRETAKIDTLVAEQEKLIALLKEKRQAVVSHAVTKSLDPDAPMKDSGIEWLGEVPAHWEVAPLKRFADVIDCKHHTVNFLDEGWPIVSIRELRDDRIDLSNAKLTSRDEWEYLREGRVPQQGDLIFCRNASVGAVAYVDQEAPFCMGQDVCLIRPRGRGRFMHYQLISPVVRDQIEALLVGATIRRANVEEIRGLMVVWPTEKEQAEVAAFLDRETAKLDDLTAEAEKAIELLKERRSALISAAVTGKIDVRCLALEQEAA